MTIEAAEVYVGTELVRLVEQTLELHVNRDLSVRVRIRGGGKGKGKLLADIATTPARALRIACLFKRAAELADPSIVVRQLEAGQ
jgi:hypothetical protein